MALEAAVADEAQEQADALDLTGFELADRSEQPNPADETVPVAQEPRPVADGPLEPFSSWDAYVTYQGGHP